MAAADDRTFLQAFANTLGAPEPALRLLISILIGYPLVLIHRYSLYCKNPLIQHLYFIASGVSIALFNYGQNVVHSAVCVVVAWLLLLVIGGTLLSVIVSFIFQMTYLLVGYYLTGTDTYDIKWSMPHCVLTLRLIALTYDVYDGRKDPEKLSGDQQKTALPFTPTLIEIAGHTYFPASFMVGPQFSMRRYLDFVKGSLVGCELPPCLVPGLLRGGLGMIYLAVYQVGISWIPDAFINSDEYYDLSLWKRHIMVGLWAKITLYKYISCWLIAEGVCIMSGLAFNGRDSAGGIRWDGCRNVHVLLLEGSTQFGHLIQSFNTNTNAWVAQLSSSPPNTPVTASVPFILIGLSYSGKDANGNCLWNGCANVKIGLYEGATTFGHMIASFNTNTNAWVAQYVYKRLKFLNNRYVSQVSALLFLAVWHGLHSGYYACFFMEFVVMNFERDLSNYVKQYPRLVTILNAGPLKYIKFVILKLYVIIFMGYCLGPFVLLKLHRWWQFYNSLFFSGHVVFAGWPLYAPAVKALIKTIGGERMRLEKNK